MTNEPQIWKLPLAPNVLAWMRLSCPGIGNGTTKELQQLIENRLCMIQSPWVRSFLEELLAGDVDGVLQEDIDYYVSISRSDGGTHVYLPLSFGPARATSNLLRSKHLAHDIAEFLQSVHLIKASVVSGFADFEHDFTLEDYMMNIRVQPPPFKITARIPLERYEGPASDWHVLYYDGSGNVALVEAAGGVGWYLFELNRLIVLPMHLRDAMKAYIAILNKGRPFGALEYLTHLGLWNAYSDAIPELGLL